MDLCYCCWLALSAQLPLLPMARGLAKFENIAVEIDSGPSFVSIFACHWGGRSSPGSFFNLRPLSLTEWSASSRSLRERQSDQLLIERLAAHDSWRHCLRSAQGSSSVFSDYASRTSFFCTKYLKVLPRRPVLCSFTSKIIETTYGNDRFALNWMCTMIMAFWNSD